MSTKLYAQAERALALTRQRGERGLEAWAHWLIGEIASHRTPADPTVAEAHHRDALALAEAIGMRPLAARAQQALGALHR